ncbi:MAG: hypothetical protein IRZ24_06540 [Thermogemmatispora sp.]|nr:hypothetical protein [Thermogemmatispora sp.]
MEKVLIDKFGLSVKESKEVIEEYSDDKQMMEYWWNYRTDLEEADPIDDRDSETVRLAAELARARRERQEAQEQSS